MWQYFRFWAGMILGTTMGWTQDAETLQHWNWPEKKVVWQRGETTSEQLFSEITSWGNVAERRGDGFLVVLASGGWLAGYGGEMVDETLHLETVSWGKIEIPLEECAGILLPPDFSEKTFSDGLKRLLAVEFSEDFLELRNGDRLTGEWGGWKEGKVEFLLEEGEATVELTLETTAIRRLGLASRLRQKERNGEIPLLLVGLRDGSLFPVYETDAIQKKLDTISPEEVVYLESCRRAGENSEITEGLPPVSNRQWRQKLFPFTPPTTNH